MRTRRSTPAKSLAILAGLCCLIAALLDCHTKSGDGSSPARPEPVANMTPDAGPAYPPGSPVAWPESAMVKIRPDTPVPSPPPSGGTVNLVGARNEFLSFQIVIQGGINGGHDLYVSFDHEFKGPGTIGGADVTLYREDFLDLDKPTFLYADGGTSPPGRWPDPLVPDVDEIAHEKRNAFPFKVPPGEARAVWVDLHVPMDAEPGTYTGSFQVLVTADGFQPNPLKLQFPIPVALTVVDARLPSTPTLTTAFLFYVPKMCEAHDVPCDLLSGQAKSLLQGYLRMGLEHRISLSSAFDAYNTPEEWSAFDAIYGPFLDGTADTRLPGAKMTSVQYGGARDPDAYATFARHYKDHGWFDRAYDYSADEPPRTIPFTEARAQALLARKATILDPDHADPPIRTMITISLPTALAHDLGDAMDVVSPQVNLVDSPQSPYSAQSSTYADFLKDPQHSVWLYQSCSTHGCVPGDFRTENVPDGGWPSLMIDAAAAKNRSMEWLSFRMNAGGEFYYETALSLATAWTNQYMYSGNGEGNLFYPGLPSIIGGTTAVPVASIRLKLIRLGIQDFEWLKLAAARNADCAQQAVQMVVPSFYQVPDNGAIFEVARQQLISCAVAPPDGGS